MEGDILLASALASILKNQTAKNAGVTTPTTPPTNTTGAGITQEQINQLSGAIGNAVESAVSQIQIPAPVVNIPPISVPPAQVQIPDTIQANISEAQLARIVDSIQASGVQQGVKMKQVQNRFLQIPNTAGTTINTLAGGAPNGSYPNIVLIDTIQFTENVNLIAIVLSVSMLNTGTEPMGVYAGRVQGNLLNLTSSSDPTIRATDIYLSLLTHNNSTGVTNAPASRTSSIAFSPTTAPVQMKSGQSIGIYACCQNIATALLSADLSVFYFAEDMSRNAG